MWNRANNKSLPPRPIDGNIVASSRRMAITISIGLGRCRLLLEFDIPAETGRRTRVFIRVASARFSRRHSESRKSSFEDGLSIQSRDIATCIATCILTTSLLSHGIGLSTKQSGAVVPVPQAHSAHRANGVQTRSIHAAEQSSCCTIKVNPVDGLMLYGS